MDIATMPRPQRAPESIDGFLARHHAVVVDVLPGAAPATRRLLVGHGDGPTVTHAIAVSTDGSTLPLDTEEQVLGVVPRLPGELARTMPRVVGRVRMTTDQEGLAVTAVPGLGPSTPGTPRVRAGQLLLQVSDWLALLWRESATGESSATLATSTLPAFLQRYGDSLRLRSAHLQLQAAHDRVAQFSTGCTVGHGCLCARHVKIGGDRVVGVDDWTLGSVSANPLLDLGGFASRLAGSRLPEVLAGRTSHAAMYRQFVASGLSRLGLPRSLWRDVLLLAHFEIAYAALERGEPDQIGSLMAAVSGLGGRP
ncbi:MAG TPA: hypothetical protein VI452_15335 [Marmoricola sp.]